MINKGSLILFVFLVLIGLGSSATNVSECQTISSAGEYVLNQSLNATTTCITISSDNVSLDLNGFNLTGDGGASDYGVFVYNSKEELNNITILNGSIYSFERGIYLSSSSNNTLSNIATDLNGYGILLSSSSDNILSNIISNLNTEYGIFLSSSSDNILSNITSNLNTERGILLFSSSNNTLSNITSSSNSIGIYLTSSSDNNSLSSINSNSNSYGIYLDSSSDNNLTDITSDSNTQSGIYVHSNSDSNILSRINSTSNTYGIYLASSSNNILENNNMNNNTYNFRISGLYANSYFNHVISSNNIVDYSYKIYYNYSASSFEFNSITVPDAGMVVCANCFNVTYKNLNLNHHNFQGLFFYNVSNSNVENINSNSNSYGIYLSSSSNNTISNITSNLNTEHGIYLLSSSNNTLSNITSNSNNYGIYLRSNSDNNSLSNITSNSNTEYGIYLRSNSDNNLTDLTLNSNNYGIYLSSSSNNTLSNITLSSNSLGIYGLSSSDNNLTNLTLNSNLRATYLESGSNNLLKEFKFNHNLNTSLIQTNFIDENIERVYNQNENLNFSFNITLINGTATSNYDYNFIIYPSTSFTSTNNSENLSINFTPVKQGIYTLKLNVTTLDNNNTEVRNFIFLVGNSTNSSTIRFYMHEDEPTHGQSKALSETDSGSMFSYPTTTEETRNCGAWVQFQPDEILNKYFLIKNVSIGWHYKSSANPTYSKIQRYVDYSLNGDYEISFLNSTDYIFNITNFTNLNITSDYAWRFYWLSLKLRGGSPYAKSNATQQSYADFTYIFTGPKIEEFREQTGSDIRDIRLLSSVWNNDEKTNTTLEFDGEGNFSITLNLSAGSYNILYDGIACSLNENCTINSNSSSGLINLTLGLGSYHYLNVYETPTFPTADVDPNTGGSSGSPTYYLNETQLNQGYSKPLGKNYKYKFDIRNETHILKIDNINATNGTATITISSEPQTKTLEIGEEWKVDLNSDGIYDLFVKLNNFTGTKINVFIQRISEKINFRATGDIVGDEDSQEKEDLEKIKKKFFETYFFISILVGSLILLVVLFFIGRYFIERFRIDKGKDLLKSSFVYYNKRK